MPEMREMRTNELRNERQRESERETDRQAWCLDRIGVDG